MSRGHKLVGILLIILGACAGIFILIELALLLSPSLLTSGFASALPWPIACTTRECVSTQNLATATRAQAAFATTTNQPVNSTAVILTTLIRQQLVHLALPTNTVAQPDITSYRTDVLHLTDAQTIKQTTGLTINQYDQLVIRPFLEQEALKQLHKATSLDDLFHQLAQERSVFVLPRGMSWDRDKAAVTAN